MTSPIHRREGLQPVTLRPERFYWGILNLEKVQSTGERSRLNKVQLGYLFEPLLPVPLETVDAVYARMDASHVLAVAMDKDALATLAADSALSLTPEALPTCIADRLSECSIDPNDLNLLIGEYTPRHVRTLRRRSGVACALMLGIALVLCTTGLIRRADATERAVAQSDREHARLIEQVVDGSTGAAAQPATLLLTAELRRLQQTRGSRTDVPSLFDATGELVHILRRWPSDVHMLTEFLTIQPSTINIRGTVIDDDLERVMAAFTNIEGWQRQQPEVNRGAETSNVTIRYVRQTEKGRM